MTEVEKLIPEIREFQKDNNHHFNVEDWIAIKGNIKLAIGYSSIFWPDFVEYEDCVFLKSHFSLENYNEWKKVDYVKHFSQIEYVINHIHILDLFLSEKHSDIKKEQVVYLGNILREMYDSKLKTQFKHRKFVVTFNDQDETSDLIDYEMSFHQESNELRETGNGANKT